MADGLSLLRSYTIEKKEIIQDKDNICFGDLQISKFSKTNYVINRTQPKEYYTIETIHYLLCNEQLSHPNYVQKAAAANIPVVRFPDRKDLLGYLHGEKECSINVDKMFVVELAQSRITNSIDRTSKRLHFESDLLSAKLDEKKEDSFINEDSLGQSQLSQVLGVEKIANLKRKMLAKKKSTIQEDSDEEAEQQNLVESIEIPVRKHEIITCDRLSILRCSKHDLNNQIISIIKSLKFSSNTGTSASKEISKENTRENSQLLNKEQQEHNSKKLIQYSRYDQELFNKNDETDGFKINTLGSFNALITSDKSKSAFDNKPKLIPQKKESRTPIIIVPSGTHSLINLSNVLSFLQHHKYENPLHSFKCKDNEILIQKQKEIIVNSNKQTISIPIRCTDNPSKLSEVEWKKVVGVFVMGPTWQFKGWPWLLPDGSPTEIFTRIKAFYLSFEDELIDSNVKKWDVHILKIHKNKRHADRATVMKFWEILDSFVSKSKKDLRY